MPCCPQCKTPEDEALEISFPDNLAPEPGKKIVADIRCTRCGLIWRDVEIQTMDDYKKEHQGE